MFNFLFPIFALSGGTMDTIITDITKVVTAAFEWAGQAVTFVMDNPIVAVFFLLPLVGLGIGFLKRLVRG